MYFPQDLPDLWDLVSDAFGNDVAILAESLEVLKKALNTLQGDKAIRTSGSWLKTKVQVF